MKISILLICYNQENYISKCIDSIIMQNIPYEYEVIVADDCSSDGTMTIIKDKLLGKVSNLRILDNAINHGISKNYQRSFAECKGEYIAVMEGDDYWTNPNRLLKHIDFLEEHRECVLSMNRYFEYNENTNVYLNIGWRLEENYKYVTTREMATGNKLGNFSACVFRKSDIDAIKPDLYDLEIADWMVGMVLSENGLIAILKEIMSVRRVHDNGEWSKIPIQKREKMLIEHTDVYNKYLDYKYDKEFSLYKKAIYKSGNSKSFNYRVIDFIPPIVILIFKVLLPKVVIIFMRKVFFKFFK
jgi:glycosyltransferase involved in cell wall biosynthesis